jgi:hypothetical protein
VRVYLVDDRLRETDSHVDKVLPERSIGFGRHIVSFCRCVLTNVVIEARLRLSRAQVRVVCREGAKVSEALAP